MRGTMIIVKPDNLPVEVIELDRPPDIEELNDAVGGYIEAVPFFHRINFRGAIRPCVALCNENGKLEGLPLNRFATAIWVEMGLRAGEDLLGADGEPKDWLVGNVVILWGDREFMTEL